MKKIAIFNKIFISLILSLLLFSSCDKDPSLSIDPKEITVEAVGGVFSVTVNSNGEWTATVENADINNWCSLENSSGKENGEVKIKISENPDSLPREAIIKVSLENLTQEIKISQNGFISEVIPFSEYSLVNSSCYYLPFRSDSLIIINTAGELNNYINCSNNNPPEIDFSEHSLLLAKGGTYNGVWKIDINFSRTAIHTYSLDIVIYLDYTAVPQGWLTSIIVPKIENEDTIILNVQKIQ